MLVFSLLFSAVRADFRKSRIVFSAAISVCNKVGRHKWHLPGKEENCFELLFTEQHGQ